jgi:putative DNA primase/helicase
MQYDDFPSNGRGMSREEREARGQLRKASASAAVAAAARLVMMRNESPEITIDQVPHFTDDWLALVFTQRHPVLRYCAEWSRWMKWDGARWHPDKTIEIYDLARKICREIAVQCSDQKDAKHVINRKTIASVVALAASDRKHATEAEQWDGNPWLLNTPGGTIDLKTGACSQHRQADFITKVAAVTPGGDCPTWRSFLDKVTAGDEELQGYLQRVVGYALTGTTTEHALFFLYGTGANGKSVFINTINGILADYQKTAPIETFTASTSDRHPTDLAGLRGARLVTSIETEEGRRWAESKIKALTGGDKISARFMRQDFFEYTPQFRLLIAGNHKPGLRSVDEAIRRRFNLIPFTVTIPPEERDPDLTEKLKKEWSGILQWMIQGCLDWQRGGLAPPKAVTEATAAYLESEDAVSTWIEECCVRKAEAFEPRTKLYVSWRSWAERTGEDPRMAKWLYQKLEMRDRIFLHKSDGVRGFRGLRVRSDWECEG